MSDDGIRIRYSALEHYDVDTNKKYLYLFQTDDDNTYFATTSIPTIKTSMENYYDWMFETTDVVNFNLIGFMTSISNKSICKSFNITLIADEYGVDLSKINIIEFIQSFKHTSIDKYYSQIDYYMKYIKAKQEKET